ncbi:MAG: ABC transporter permease, partial [Alphaproteobacteria bacterium]|nr:ABC transporter permease [Alphaproteobacteria bacterium]
TTMRGVGPKALKVRPELKIVSGRMFQPGRREMVVGILAHAHDRDMKVGDNVAMPDGAWPIVGVFTTGDVLESQVLGDADTVMTATHKKNFNSVLVRLASYNSLATFKNALSANPALAVSVERHNDWYKRFSAGFSGFLTAIAYVIGGILAVGALFGCLNTMYAAVSTRAREIATLRALGFGAFPVAVSVMLEAALLSVAGGIVGRCHRLAAVRWSGAAVRQQHLSSHHFRRRHRSWHRLGVCRRPGGRVGTVHQGRATTCGGCAQGHLIVLGQH